MSFQHKSVLLNESVNALITKQDGIYVDCTLGGGGHASEIVKRLDSNGYYVGIDQDPAAIEAGKKRISDANCRTSIIRSNFSRLPSVLADLAIKQVDGVLFDLGVSSYQLDTAERGFSYMQDGPLDMRMNPNARLSAEDIISSYDENKLAKIIYEYGEERWAKRIAAFIVKARELKPLKTTGELVDVIKAAIPAGARREGPHPAKRTFQAIRIAVNDELGILAETFKYAIDALKPNGRICIITFHSLEDRIAKQVLQSEAKGCICPPRAPICTCGHQPRIKLLGKAIAPSSEELENNPRARSAKLRVAVKL